MNNKQKGMRGSCIILMIAVILGNSIIVSATGTDENVAVESQDNIVEEEAKSELPNDEEEVLQDNERDMLDGENWQKDDIISAMDGKRAFQRDRFQAL